MTAYYNEIDPYAAEWLRRLVARGLIAPGDVDERDMREVTPDDLRGYTQCHFFADIGVWSYALRLSGWPDDEPVWTGSCPCQPFSAAGRQKGFADDRHLWPEWFRLIRECRPPVVFGEQVASKAGLAWLDLVSADLEGAGYAVGAADLCAAGVGAPHIRQRLWLVAERLGDADDTGPQRRAGVLGGATQRAARSRGVASGMADSSGKRQHGSEGATKPPGWCGTEDGSETLGLDDPTSPRRDGAQPQTKGETRHEARMRLPGEGRRLVGLAGPTDSFWEAADWLFCRDGKWRPVEPGTFPLAHGASARVGRLRAYGNAIVPQVAAEFIKAYLET